MPWLRAGDNAATHPVVLRPAAHGGNTNEVFGFVLRCALQSAGHTTDYIVDQGTAALIGGDRTTELVRIAVKAGYLTPCRHDGLKAWRLIEDPDFIHMRLKAEITWEAQQRADSANTALTAPVRHRDGDACRYCGVIVYWSARKGGRRGSYDHRVPGKAATVDTLVVACGSCNSGRRDDPIADDRYPLRPVPITPYYSAYTAKFLASQGIQVEPTDAQRPDHMSDTAPATQQPAEPRTATPETGHRASSVDLQISADSSEPSAHMPVRDGVGSGRVGSAAVSTADPPGRRKRSARGRPR